MTRLMILLAALIWAASPAYAGADAAAAAHARGDFATAFREWSAAAKRGDGIAQYNLGQLYRQGRGTTKDLAAALKWYLRAAEQGVVLAQRNVGMMYGLGIGTEKNDVEAYRWLSIAAALGDPQSRRTLDYLGKRMTRKQIGEAKFRAATFEPKPEKAGGE